MLKALNLTVALSLSLFFISMTRADEPTSKQKRTVKSIASTIDQAGRLYKSKKYKTAAQKIEQTISRIQQLAAVADADLMKLIRPEYDRLAKAHQLLTENGQTLSELKDLPVPRVAGEAPISFKNEIAPFLVARCGRCHVRGSRGDFNAPNYMALMASTMVAQGIPADSRIVQVIEDEEMPPGGSVEPKNLATLKKWIQQGARFDGDDPNQALSAMTDATPDQQRPRLTPAQPTGSETVSFGLDIAPILLNACSECHIDTNRPRGNFSMANFANLLRGGDSGNPFEPGNSGNSTLIKRLRGIDSQVMPPTGKLNDKIIDKIAVWINEGAKFDGGDNPRLATRTVAAVSRAASQSHADLGTDRQKLAQKNWRLIMTDVANESLETQNYRVIGSVKRQRLEEIGKLAEKITPKISSALKLNSKGPFIKGNATIFVFERRYDFNELGVMMNGREIPKQLKGYWNNTKVDAFASILLSRNRSPKTATATLAQQIAAMRVAEMAADVPRWFADGVGYWAAAKAFPKEDDVELWDAQALGAASTMKAAGDFATGSMPEDQAALASYLFIKRLRTDSGKFKQLFRLMLNGASFEKSFTETLGQPPAEFFKPKNNRNR